MTDQPPLAESMGRDSRSGSLQRLVSRRSIEDRRHE